MFRIPTLSLLITLAIPATKAYSADHLISDWEDRSSSHSLGGSWYYVTDQSSQGQSRVLTGDTLFTPAAIDTTSFAAGAGGSSACLQMGFVFGAVKPTCGDSCFFDPEVAIEASLASDTMPWVDFTGSAGISFQAKADKPMKVRFIATTSEVADYAYYGSDLQVGTEWKTFTVALDSSATFAQPAWKSASVSFNKAAVTGFVFLASKEVNLFDTATLFLDDVKVLNWEKPAAVSIRRSVRDARARAGALPASFTAGGLLTAEIPAAWTSIGGMVEAWSAEGSLLGRMAFRKGDKTLKMPVASGSRRIVLRFRK